MAVVANPLVVRIFINSTLTSHENGWAERWPIWETDWSLALPIALQMVQARQNVLSSNSYIQWACLGTVAPPYYEQTVVTDPLYPLPQWGPAAFDMQGVLFSLNSTSGENAPRLFRAVEGTSINAKTWVYADMPIPFQPPALPADLTTAPKDLLWQNTLATFRQYASTQQPMIDGHHGDGDGYWVESYQQIVYRYVGSRRVGSPWRRMSWQAYPYQNAPQFSPCGCVVTVNRRAYAIPCRFGEGWTLRGIYYYDAPVGATVMTFQTPFCCWDRSKEYDDFSGVGEARKYKSTDWRNGVSGGTAPGVMWTGPSYYFGGFAPEPPIPTPTFMLPTCDAPIPPSWLARGARGDPPADLAAEVIRKLLPFTSAVVPTIPWIAKGSRGDLPAEALEEVIRKASPKTFVIGYSFAWITKGARGESPTDMPADIVPKPSPATFLETYNPSPWPNVWHGDAKGDEPTEIPMEVIYQASPKTIISQVRIWTPKRQWLEESGLEPMPEWVRGRLFPFNTIIQTKEFSWILKRAIGDGPDEMPMEIIRKQNPLALVQQRFNKLPKPPFVVWDQEEMPVELTPRRVAPLEPIARNSKIPKRQEPEKSVDAVEVVEAGPERIVKPYPFR